MKKMIVTMLCMVFALGMSYAQTTDEFIDSLINSQNLQKAFVKLVSSDYNSQKTFPIVGKTKFARQHNIYQTVEISTIFGKDKKDDDDQSSDTPTTPLKPTDIENKLSAGLNIGYSLIFVPGVIRDDKLQVNRFGFAYSTGLVAEFDNQEHYGVTCDFLFKLGVETGNNHPLGIGLDFLVGSGKTAGVLHFYVDKEWEDDFDTYWCFKYGGQLWLNTNLLSTAAKNTDVLAFARFVYSKEPASFTELDDGDDVIGEWNPEAWQFGITLRYRF